MSNKNRIEIQTRRTAQIYTAGEPSDSTKDVWLVFHGYGQLAEYFIKHFEVLEDGKTWVLAPEALSRFYVNGLIGRVGASWMTKEDRLNEIEDQAVYLDQVYEMIREKIGHDFRLHVLGFSQGTATIWRWLKSREIRPNTFVIWAGNAPKEYDAQMNERLSQARIFQVYGAQDQFVNDDFAQKQEEILQAHFPQIQTLQFEGKHVMDVDTLVKISKMIAQEEKN